MRKLTQILKYVFIIFTTLILVFLAYFFLAIQIEEPQINQKLIKWNELKKVNDSSFTYQDSWLRKNRFGLWEMYISGSPEELGIKNGILSQQLIHKQEEAFVMQIKQMIPSDFYLRFLKYIVAYTNRKLPDYIPDEYLKEIKAISIFASDEFDFIGDNYVRQLNYHAAHDIGHAMQNLHLVECTAFGVWDGRTEDSTLLIGRNFDFYVGDAFAENKIILFVKPKQGYSFASITWGGMIGVVSGMNNQGLTITLNSAKSDIPLTAKTPVSIIAREILQYASTIEEAYEVAKKHPSFVAESFMIGSANDNEVAIIEKTPDTTILFQTESNKMILTNHFQSDVLFPTKINQENIHENVTDYRWKRVEEKLAEQIQFNELDFAKILRDTKGLENEDIGLGNEGAINQLIAHHSVIFKPSQKIFWISSSPYQLGAYPAYNLDSIFQMPQNPTYSSRDLVNELIPADSIFLANQYPNFLQFKSLAEKLKKGQEIDIEQFIESNPNNFYTYELIGDYLFQQQKFKQANFYYQKALLKFIPNLHERKRIEGKIEK